MIDNMINIEPNNILPLRLENINYSINNRQLLKNISCQFNKGKRYCIIGPNGAGKTMLLRLCHGLIKPDSGKLTWQNNHQNHLIKYQAMVFQRPVMLRRNSWDNINYALSVQNIPRNKRKSLIEQVLTITGLLDQANQPARQLSLGQQQRLAIARALVIKPQILFMDEPTASLDPPATYQIEQLINQISNDGVTIIMTTHDLGQAKRIGEEILFMFRGHIKEQANSDDFFKKPQNDLAKSFINGDLLWWKRRPEGDDVQIINHF